MALLTSQAPLRASLANRGGALTGAHGSADQRPQSMRPTLGAGGMDERDREGMTNEHKTADTPERTRSRGATVGAAPGEEPRGAHRAVGHGFDGDDPARKGTMVER